MGNKPSVTATSSHRVAVLGMTNAGKTTLLHAFNQQADGNSSDIRITIPTIGFNVEELSADGFDFVSWDLGGSDRIRPLWRQLLQGVQAVIFVVDSCDRGGIGEAAGELAVLLPCVDETASAASVTGATKLPLLVLAHKQDLEASGVGSRMTVAELTEALALEVVAAGRHWHIAPTSVTGDLPNAANHKGRVELDGDAAAALKWLQQQLAPARHVDQ